MEINIDDYPRVTSAIHHAINAAAGTEDMLDTLCLQVADLLADEYAELLVEGLPIGQTEVPAEIEHFINGLVSGYQLGVWACEKLAEVE